MGFILFLFVFFLFFGGYYVAQNESMSIYEKQRREYELDQKKYYRTLNRAIKKYNKNKTLTSEERKTLRRHVREQLDENPNDLTLQAIKENLSTGLEQSESSSVYDTPKSNFNFGNPLYDNIFNTDYNTDNTTQYLSLKDEPNITSVSNSKIAQKYKTYCECLTSKKFKNNPAIGREKEIEQLMISILTPSKSAMVIGYPRSWQNSYYRRTCI